MWPVLKGHQYQLLDSRRIAADRLARGMTNAGASEAGRLSNDQVWVDAMKLTPLDDRGAPTETSGHHRAPTATTSNQWEPQHHVHINLLLLFSVTEKVSENFEFDPSSTSPKYRKKFGLDPLATPPKFLKFFWLDPLAAPEKFRKI